MDVEVRTIEDAEWDAYLRVFELAFSGPLDEGEPEVIRTVTDLDRCHVAVEDGAFVGAASARGFRMTVPGGGELPVGGVTGVGVVPTHRRRGVNTALMARQLADVRARGEAAAVLFASEAGIYGRFGYGIATWSAAFAIEASRTAFVLPGPAAGATTLLERDDALPRIQAIADAARRGRPGSMAPDRAWLEAELWQPEDERKGRPQTFAIHRSDAGEDDAFAVYRAKHDWSDGVPKLELEVRKLQALDPSAYAAIWRFLFDVDLVERIVAEHRPVDEPLLHLLLEPRRLQLRVRDGLFLRLLDLPAAMAARGFAGDGRLVVDVADPFLPELEGRFSIAAAAGRGACTRSTDDPDLACSVVELGAAYLGGTTFAELARAGRVREERPGAIARADAMFATDAAPWCSSDI